MPSRLIRIARIRYDPLRGAFVGEAIRALPGGGLRRERVHATGAPGWDHVRAAAALRAAAL